MWSPTPRWSPRTPPTGPAGSSATPPPSSDRRPRPRWPGWSPSVASWAWPWFPREGTPGWSAARSPGTARWCWPSAASTTLGPVDDRAGQITVGAGVTLAALQQAAGGRRVGLRRGHRQPRLGHGGRHRGHQRRRAARPPLRGHPGPGGRPRGGARHRCGRLPPRGSGEGQHRVRLARSASAGARGRWRWSPAARLRLVPAHAVPDRGAARLPHVTDAVDAAGLFRRSLPSLEACELFVAPGVELVCSVTGSQATVRRARTPPTCWSRWPTGPIRPRPSPRRPTPLAHVQDVAVATDAGPQGRAVALPRVPHRGHQHARALPTSST